MRHWLLTAVLLAPIALLSAPAGQATHPCTGPALLAPAGVVYQQAPMVGPHYYTIHLNEGEVLAAALVGRQPFPGDPTGLLPYPDIHARLEVHAQVGCHNDYTYGAVVHFVAPEDRTYALAVFAPDSIDYAFAYAVTSAP